MVPEKVEVRILQPKIIRLKLQNINFPNLFIQGTLDQKQEAVDSLPLLDQAWERSFNNGWVWDM